MAVLWSLGSGTVTEVKNELDQVNELEPAYNTVLTQLRSLAQKGCVRAVPVGRAYRFIPMMRLDDARQDALERLVWIYYAGDHAAFARDFLSQARLSPPTLATLGRIVQERLRTRRTPSAPARSSAG